MPALLMAACGGFGTVNQGQVIEYQPDTRMVTLVVDSNYRDPAHPRFDVLPPVRIQAPADSSEMGPVPQAGKLLRLDAQAHLLTIFNAATQRIEDISYTEGTPQGACPKEPVVDPAKRTITLCIDRKATPVFIPQPYFALPDDTWKVGDEVRYYTKDSARALRMMNVTRTNLNTAGK